MSTVDRPNVPFVPASSPDDDPTGVRALLSSLPEPDPMPDHLVGRINSILAAEQAQRAARTSSGSATPLLARVRRRPGRILFAMAGAAAAVAIVATLSSNLFAGNQTTATSQSAAGDVSSAERQASGAAPPEAKAQDSGAVVAAPAGIQIRLSNVRYTRADFVPQVQTLRAAALEPAQPTSAFAGVGTIGTASGVSGCLRALGVTAAQLVRADLAFYEGEPAVVIIATTNGKQSAYAVGRRCSPADAALLHPATPLP